MHINVDSPYINVLKRALKTAFWVIRIVIPTSLVVTLLDYYGVIGYISRFTEPLFSFIGLPGEAAVVYVTSVFLPLYVAIAAMGALALDLRELTIIALMCLIAHNLPVESAVQRRCGLPVWQSVSLRIGFSFAGALLLDSVLPGDMSMMSPLLAQSGWAIVSVADALRSWFMMVLSLSVKLIAIIVALMYVQDYLKRHGILQIISRYMSPFMKMCGLKPSSSFIWLIANIVGLTYGAGIMAQEVEGASDADIVELRNVNRHVALNHSLVEDTLIFTMIGVGWYWLIVPRLIFAVVVVWTSRLLNAKCAMCNAQ